jgi:propanol-preferring alcohol dehydrogenase
MILESAGRPLIARDVPQPDPSIGQVLVRVTKCGICRTDLHVVDGELPGPKLPLVPGHEIIGRIAELGQGVEHFHLGDRVGIPWLGWTCGQCEYCASGRENLCDLARFTGYTIDGGYAEFTVADARYCFPIPDAFDDVTAAPFLCAGLIGYRSLRKTGNAKRLGLYGFGAAAHIVFGAVWAGGSDEAPPEPLDGAIIFAPVGALVPAALRAVRKGGTVVCGGIHMSDIPSFPYSDLWEERMLCSVANLTRLDGSEFFEVAPKVPIRTETQSFPLDQANEALDRLRSGQLSGAAVLAVNAA